MSITPKAASGKPAAAQTSQQLKRPNEEGLIGLLTGDDMKNRLKKLLTSPAMLDRFIGVMTGAMKSTPRLAECTPASVVGALLRCASLRLEPNTPAGQCYLIPRQNKNGSWECSWELGYKGAIDLAYRADIKVIKAKVVFELDTFDIDYGKSKGMVVHKPYLLGERGKVIGYWAEWCDADGNGDVLYMSVDEIQSHAQQYSKSYNSEYSPWNTAFDQMALKTVIKRVLKFAPQSIDDLRNADDDDGSIIIDSETGEVAMISQKRRAENLLRASPDEFVIDAEPSRESEAPAPAAQVPQQVQDQALSASTEEAHRLAILKVVKAKINTTPLPPEQIVEKIGMALSMVDKATLEELNLAHKRIVAAEKNL